MSVTQRERQRGSVLLMTMLVIILVSMVVLGSSGTLLQSEVGTRNEQFRLNVVTAASSEIGSQIHQVNSNDSNADDALILDLLDRRGAEREFELDIDNAPHRVLTDPPHIGIAGVRIDGEMTSSVSCPGSSVGAFNVMMGTIHARADLADTGIGSSQQQHFLYCWP